MSVSEIHESLEHTTVAQELNMCIGIVLIVGAGWLAPGQLVLVPWTDSKKITLEKDYLTTDNFKSIYCHRAYQEFIRSYIGSGLRIGQKSQKL